MASAPQGREKKPPGRLVDISINRKALREYHISERFEAGMELKGTEVKSIRSGLANINGAYARVENGQVFAYDVDIQAYVRASFAQHEPKRSRRLAAPQSASANEAGSPMVAEQKTTFGCVP